MQTQENIRAALQYIPASDRETWLRMGMALKSELDDDGFDLWSDWSQQDESYNERDAKAVWRSINPNGRVTIGTLIHEAKRHGYVNGDTRPHRPTADELLERKRKADEADADRARGHAEAQKKAIALWNAASLASDDHPYLKRKQVKAHGIRRNNWPQRSKPDCLLIPMVDAAGVLWNLQAIFTEKDPALDRDKDFLAGGRTRGCYHLIGEPDSTICIAEGFATGASIHEATGHAVVIAFSSGNLESVARAIRTQHPDARIIICADNDQSKAKNSGLDQGRLAAQAIGGHLAYPEREKDCNDMALLQGIKAVRSAVINAKPAVVSMGQPDEGNEPREGEIPEVAKESDDQALARLAALSPLDYDRVRTLEAERLQVRIATLDDLVKARRKEKDTASDDFPDVTPWLESVDGAALLFEVSNTIQRFVICSSDTARAVALWIVMTWFIDQVQIAPLAIITSPEKRCGKSQLLTLIGKLSRKSMSSSSISPAALFRAIELWRPTLLIDEADAFMRDNEELRCILNAGHTRDNAFVTRTVGEDHVPKRFCIWGAKARSTYPRDSPSSNRTLAAPFKSLSATPRILSGHSQA